MAVCVWPCVDRRPLNRAVGGLACSLAGAAGSAGGGGFTLHRTLPRQAAPCVKRTTYMDMDAARRRVVGKGFG